MPLAVDRFLASELPREVVLDEGSAMIPGQGLRSVPALEVVARVTASGGVRARPRGPRGASRAPAHGKMGAPSLA